MWIGPVGFAETNSRLIRRPANVSLRPYVARRLVVVFGCGGDRDPGKRQMMGAIAAEKADRVIVTDDNPRSEEPAAIRAAILHRAKTAHPPDHLEATSLEQNRFAWALFSAREHRSHHHARCTSRECLHDITRVLHAAVGDDGDIACTFHGIEDRRELRNADARHNARRADRARANANFHRIDTTLDECGSALARSNVADDQLHIGERLACERGCLENAVAMTVRRIDHQHVSASIDQRFRALHVAT